MSELEERRKFYEGIEAGAWTLAQTLKEMRKIMHVTQIEFAEQLDIAPRIIIDIERGKGNPTLKTLQKIARPFALQLGFCVRKK